MLIVPTGRARYNVANSGVEFSLSLRGVGPLDFSPANPHYDRVDNMIPHYEQGTFTTNEVQIIIKGCFACSALLIRHDY